MGFFACSRFFKADFHGVRQVVATVDLAAPTSTTASAATKNVAKDVAKGFTETRKPFSARATTHVGVHTCMAMLVVGCPLLRVRQHFVGLFGLFEFFFGGLGRITLIAVGVVLHRQFAICLFDLVIGGAFGYAQHFVKISFGHVCVPFCLNTNAASRSPAGAPDAAAGSAVRAVCTTPPSPEHQPFLTSFTSASTTSSSAGRLPPVALPAAPAVAPSAAPAAA